MKTTNEYLDTVKVKLHHKSDGDLARWLKIDRRYISDYRRSHLPLSELHAFTIEEALHLPRGEVLAANRIERAKTEQERQAWQNFMKRLRTAAATVALTAVGLSVAGPNPAEAVTLKVTSQKNEPEINHLKTVSDRFIHYAHVRVVARKSFTGFAPLCAFLPIASHSCSRFL